MLRSHRLLANTTPNSTDLLINRISPRHLLTSTSDILLAVNGEASHTAGGIFAGLRHDLFSRVKRPGLAVEQVCRWLCHTAVTPILAMRTWSYLLPHILRPITIRIPD